MPISTIFIGILPGPTSMTAPFPLCRGRLEAGASCGCGHWGSCWWCWCWQGGFSGETMAHCVFQILPYLLEVGAVGSVVWALVRLTSGGETLRAYVYKATVPGAAGTGRAGDVRRRGRNAGDGAVHDRPRNGGTAGRAAAVPFAEGSAFWPGHGCCGAMCRPCHGRGRRRRRRTDVFCVCERRIAISVLFKYI